MPDIQKGYTWVPGSTGHDAADLNNMLDLAVILPSFITDRPAAAMAATDTLAYYQASQTRIARGTFAQIVSLVPSNAAAGTPSLRKIGTGATDVPAGSMFPTTLDGIRRANLTSADTVASGQDAAFPSVAVSGTAVDWNVAQVRSKAISSNTAFTFSNNTKGWVLFYIAGSGGAHATFPGYVDWMGGTAPVQPNGKAMWCFFIVASTTYGFMIDWT